MTITCPHCSTELDAPNELLGQEVECPNCNGSFVVKHEKVISSECSKHESITSSSFCAECGAELHAGEKNCRQCGREIKAKASFNIKSIYSAVTNLIRKYKKWLLNPVVCFVLGAVLSSCVAFMGKTVNGDGKLYRLKYATKVECVDESGIAKGNENLQAGTVIAYVSKDTRSVSNARLKPSNMSYMEFINTRPQKGAVFEATIKLSDFYYGKAWKYKDYFWSIEISVPDSYKRFQGFVYKELDIGKEIFEATRSGAKVKCLVLIKSLDDDTHPEQVFIEDFCALND